MVSFMIQLLLTNSLFHERDKMLSKRAVLNAINKRTQPVTAECSTFRNILNVINNNRSRYNEEMKMWICCTNAESICKLSLPYLAL